MASWEDGVSLKRLLCCPWEDNIWPEDRYVVNNKWVIYTCVIRIVHIGARKTLYFLTVKRDVQQLFFFPIKENMSTFKLWGKHDIHVQMDGMKERNCEKARVWLCELQHTCAYIPRWPYFHVYTWLYFLLRRWGYKERVKGENQCEVGLANKLDQTQIISGFLLYCL